MIKKLTKILLILGLSIGLLTVSHAQEQTGSIKGTITDSEGSAIPGVTVTASSDALMGTKAYITTEVGAFRFPALPPGIYTLKAESQGFKTVTRRNIFISVGMVVTLNITLEMTAIEEEVTVTAASPVIDVRQSKISFTIGFNFLRETPLARDLYRIVNASPGAISEGNYFQRTTSVHGSTVRSNNYALDGISVNDPVTMYPITNINFDVFEEIEIVTGGHPASSGFTDGAYVNIVTRSGGNRFTGGATFYYTNDSLSQSLWTDQQVQALGVSQPVVDTSWIDGSLSLGGPIWTDRLWFFSNVRYIKQEQFVSYVPWTDILGQFHDKWDWSHEEKMGFIKLTSQLSKKIKLMGLFNFIDRYRPVYESPSPTINFIATRIMDHERTYTGSGVLSYVLDQNTFFDLKVGYVHRIFPLYMQRGESSDAPYITDYADNYGALTSARFNETYLRKRFQTRVDFTRFQDNLFGGNHEFKAGVEFEDAYADWDSWKRENLVWPWFGSPYYFGKPVGYVSFYICGTERGSSKIVDKARKIGAYVQDSVTFADRLTLNIGLRYDRSWGWKPAATKGASGNPLSLWLGENVVSPYVAKTYPDVFPDGLNPWGELATDEWKDIIAWNTFSPRIGLTFDVFGNGKTALKASFSRYTEYLMIQYFSVVHPFYPSRINFFWIDTNLNGEIEQTDRFNLMPYELRDFDLEYAKLSIDPDAKAPYNDEFIVGISHELFSDFALRVNFIYKDKKNILEDALYSPDSGEWWYYLDQAAAQKYWIPFKTTVPSDVYGDTDLTFYVHKNPPDAPPLFYRFSTIPELKRKYWAMEFVFNKRMANGWQMTGSVVYSKAYGNIGTSYGDTWGWSGAGDNPNFYINDYGRTSLDRPLQIKLMGTVQLPFDISLSALYYFFSGTPWHRTVNIRPPSSWTGPRNAYRTFYSVRLEAPGTRRTRSWNNLNLRLEKEFWIGDFGRLGAYVDVINVLGYSDVTLGQNDVYRWQPSAEGFEQPGSLTLDPDYQYISKVSGRRTIRFSIRFTF
jgi:hypothetical protein